MENSIKNNGVCEHMDSSVESDVEERKTILSFFKELISDLIQYRELLFQMTLRDIRIRYKQAFMGFAWAILMPVLIVGSGLLIKLIMAQMAGGHLEAGSTAGMMVKSLPWAFFAGSVNFATISLTSNSELLTKIYFPREVFPIAAVFAQCFDTTIGSVFLIPVLFVFLNVSFSIQLLWVFPLAVLLFCLTIGAGLLFSCANLFFRDVKYIVQVLVTFGIFFTPVFYDAGNLGPTGSRLVMLNPLAPIFEGLRLAIVEHHNLIHSLVVTSVSGSNMIVWQPLYLVYAAVWSIVCFFGSWVLFHKLESVYAEYI